MSRHPDWHRWAQDAAAESTRTGQHRAARRKPAKERPLREPSGLCRWRHHDRCTLNSVPLLTAELRHHTVELDFAIARQEGDIRNVHVYHLDDIIKDLWLLRGKMAHHAAANGSPVCESFFRIFPSVMALLDDAIRVRKGYACE